MKITKENFNLETIDGTNLLKQICPFEAATKFKALGFEQQSLFYYVNGWLNPRCLPIDDGQMICTQNEMHLTTVTARKRGATIEFVSAYTTMELVVLMSNYYPKSIGEIAGDLLGIVVDNGEHQQAYVEFTNHAYKKYFNLFENDYSNEFPPETEK